MPSKPMTKKEFRSRLAEYRRRQAKVDAKQTRVQGMQNKAVELSKLRAGSFCHLPREIREIALAKYAEYQARHADKIASIKDPLARGRYLGCLAACASAHAKYPGSLGGYDPKSGAGWRAKRRLGWLKTRLGLRAPYAERKRERELVAAVHPGHGAPLPAEISSTNLEGI